MVKRTLPGLGLTGFWPLGDDTWKDENDANLRTLSALVNRKVKSRTTALPGTPTLGDIYIVLSTDPTNPNKVAIWDGDAGFEAWVYLAPQAGWNFYVVDEALNVQWDGAAWNISASSGGTREVTYRATLVFSGVGSATYTIPAGVTKMKVTGILAQDTSTGATLAIQMNKQSTGLISNFATTVSVLNVLASEYSGSGGLATIYNGGASTPHYGISVDVSLPRSATKKSTAYATIICGAGGAANQYKREAISVQATAEDVDELVVSLNNTTLTGTLYIDYTVVE